VYCLMTGLLSNLTTSTRVRGSSQPCRWFAANCWLVWGCKPLHGHSRILDLEANYSSSYTVSFGRAF
jgi:hypothetical protein